MFKPARMTRVLLGGHKDRMDDVIELLHAERIFHLEDFDDPTGTTQIGDPLPRGDQASDLLVRVRGLLKALDLEGVKGRAMTGEPGKALAEADDAVQPTLREVARLRNEASRLESEVSALARFAHVDVDLEALASVRSVRTFLGTARQRPDLSGIDHQIIGDGEAFAILVAVDDADRAERALAAAGFSAAALPEDAVGTPKEALARATDAHKQVLADLDAAEADLDGLREQWGGRIAAIERHLTADVDKTQAPLRFAVTGTTFHAEGWIPVDKANRLQNAISARIGDAVYFEELGDAPKGDGHHPKAKDEAPVQLRNKGLAKPYEFMLGLLGRPRYWEIDPTKLMLIFFPLFFGLMVGDLLVGLIIMAFGFYLKSNHIFGIGGPSVGRALVMGGFVAAIAGGVIFGEALGIHFTVSDEALEEGEHSWEEIIYGHDAVLAHEAGFPTEGFIFKHSSDHGVTAEVMNGTAADAQAAGGSNATTNLTAAGFDGMHPLAESTEDHGGGLTALLTPHGTTHLSVNGWFNLGYYSKVHDIQALLVWSILIAFAHLNLALLLGFRNVLVHHGATLAIQEKLSWITMQAGIGVAVWGGLAAHPPVWALPVGVGIFVFSVALLWKGVQKALGAPGFVAVLEVLGFAGNILSYTRLAAIGASKAGMALAFMAIGFDVLGGGSIHSVVGWIVYLLGMVVIIGLAMLSGGLQSLRLQFVESFQKFYEGGGRPYVPFGRRGA